MERLKRVLDLIPAMVEAGFVGDTGGSLAVRTSHGVFITPAQVVELEWRLKPEDWVLFPGEGDASMARAGRQPSRMNRLHRALLKEQANWNVSYLGYPPALLAFALAEKPLPVPEAHAGLIKGKRLDLPVIAGPRPLSELAGDVGPAVKRDLAGAAHGAVLVSGVGVLAGGLEPTSLLAFLKVAELLAQAQLWRLAGVKPAG